MRPNSTTNPDYSLQGSLGQTFVTVDAPTNTGQTLAYIGFGETAVKFRYLGTVTLQSWLADPATVPLDVRFYNTSGILADDVVTGQDSSGNYYADSWINPAFAASVSVKAPRWLRRNVAIAAPANYLAYPTAANALLLAGDANNDNFVDTLDFQILSSSFNLSTGDPGFDARADFNGDGSVDTLDFNLLASNFNIAGDE